MSFGRLCCPSWCPTWDVELRGSHRCVDEVFELLGDYIEYYSGECPGTRAGGFVEGCSEVRSRVKQPDHHDQ